MGEGKKTGETEYVVAIPQRQPLRYDNISGPRRKHWPRSPEGMLRKLAAASFVGDSSSERRKPRVEEITAYPHTHQHHRAAPRKTRSIDTLNKTGRYQVFAAFWLVYNLYYPVRHETVTERFCSDKIMFISFDRL